MNILILIIVFACIGIFAAAVTVCTETVVATKGVEPGFDRKETPGDKVNRNELQDILNEIDATPYGFRLADAPGGGWYLQATLHRSDVVTGEWGVGTGGKYYVSPHSVRAEVIQKCLGATLAYAEHEIRETFLWRGKPIYHPHYDVEALWEICDRTDTRQQPNQL